MSNMSDLNNHLFAMLDRLRDAPDADAVEIECKRADAVVQLADQVTNNARTAIGAAKLYAEHGQTVLPMLPQIGKATE